MRLAHFDCFSGISGDMVLGALVDAGLDADLLRAEIAKLRLPADLRVERVERRGLEAARVEIRIRGKAVAHAGEHHIHPHAEGVGHTRLEDLVEVLASSDLDEEVRSGSIRVFRRLAEAEARVHGVDVEEVRLHEAGAMDAVVDVVGAVAGLRLLEVAAVHSSALSCGTGLVQCAHGSYPVPVPGVLALCAGVPGLRLVQTEVEAELITPTGAAIITTLADFGRPPEYRLLEVGYGAGSRDLPSVPNTLRVRIGEFAAAAPPEISARIERDDALLVEANIDDMNPEVYGYLFDLLLERGARDVYITPVYMKKGRPGSLLSVLVDPESAGAAIETVLGETTTTGVRFHPVERRKLRRSSTTVSTEHGEVRVKVCHFDGGRRLAPEYEDCAARARERKVPILAVYEAARAAIGEEIEK